MPVSIIDLAPPHAERAAALHIAGQPGTFLTQLGPDVLTVIYRALPRSSAGFGFVAVENGTNINKEHKRVLGFVAATTSVGRLFAEMATRRAPALLPPLAARVIRQPRLLPLSLQTVLYPLLARGNNHADEHAAQSTAASAELLSIMVEPAARSRGAGAALLHALIDSCRARTIDELEVTVDAANVGARRFYARHSFAERRTFTLYGREMKLYARPVNRGVQPMA